jgi:soluble lytic murein transglycosylase-like protein
MAKELIVSLIIAYSKIFNVDPNVALSVAAVESNFNTEAVGSIGELGVFQIRPEFYPMFTKKQIKSPETNIMLGIQKIAAYQKTCHHKEDLTYLICYNYGPANARKVKNPHLFPYVKKVKAEMVKLVLFAPKKIAFTKGDKK